MTAVEKIIHDKFVKFRLEFVEKNSVSEMEFSEYQIASAKNDLQMTLNATTPERYNVKFDIFQI